jgi:integrase
VWSQLQNEYDMSARKFRKTWWVDFRFKGNRKRVRSPENSKAGAEAYEATLRQRLARGEPLKGTGAELIQKVPSCKEFSSHWYQTYVITNNKPSEQRTKRSCLSVHLVPFFGEVGLDNIGSQMVEEYKTKKLSEGLSPKTINNHLSALGKCLHTAQEWNIIKSTPRIHLLRVPPQPFDFLLEEESQELLLNIREEPWYTMVLLALRTGLRLGELIGLKWEDVNLNARMITVRRSVVKGIVGSPKSNRVRHVPLTNESCVALTRLGKSKGFIFHLRNDGPMNDKAPTPAITRMCKRAGIRRIGWHVLRHTFASHLAMKGVSIQKIQTLLGHTDVKTTMRYAHLAPSTLREAIQVLEPASSDVMAIFGQQAVNTSHLAILKHQKSYNE